MSISLLYNQTHSVFHSRSFSCTPNARSVSHHMHCCLFLLSGGHRLPLSGVGLSVHVLALYRIVWICTRIEIYQHKRRDAVELWSLSVKYSKYPYPYLYLDLNLKWGWCMSKRVFFCLCLRENDNSKKSHSSNYPIHATYISSQQDAFWTFLAGPVCLHFDIYLQIFLLFVISYIYIS